MWTNPWRLFPITQYHSNDFEKNKSLSAKRQADDSVCTQIPKRPKISITPTLTQGLCS